MHPYIKQVTGENKEKEWLASLSLNTHQVLLPMRGKPGFNYGSASCTQVQSALRMINPRPIVYNMNTVIN